MNHKKSNSTILTVEILKEQGRQQQSPHQIDRSKDLEKKMKEEISKLMQVIWSRRIRTRSTKDILLDEVIPESEYQICHKIKNLQMRIGEIWQEAIGCAEGWQNLKKGDSSGLDLINKERKIVIELKNSYNTDNSSARKHNYQK